jgi:hypothetical protein
MGTGLSGTVGWRVTLAPRFAPKIAVQRPAVAQEMSSSSLGAFSKLPIREQVRVWPVCGTATDGARAVESSSGLVWHPLCSVTE